MIRRYLVITCDHPECPATDRVEWPPGRPIPDTLPLWKSIGWSETPNGDYCRNHRHEHRQKTR